MDTWPMNAGSDWSSSRALHAKTVAEAMNLKLDMGNAADREKLRRAVLDLVAGRKMRKQKGPG
jgi:hypothetical protein